MPQAAWMQVVQPIVYEDCESLRFTIASKSPNLKMVTTKEEFDGLLRTRTAVPSHFKIFMENKDGSVVSSNAFDLVHGNVKAHTKIKAEESNKRLSLTNKGVFVREAASIVVLQSIFQTHDLKLVYITQVVESGSADAYVDSETKDFFVVVQVTRSTVNEKGLCNITKGNEYLIDQIGDKGFLIFIMLCIGDHCSGVLLLSPEDLPEIESMPPFAQIGIHIGKMAVVRKKLKLAALPQNFHQIYFLWSQGQESVVQGALMLRVESLLCQNQQIPHHF